MDMDCTLVSETMLLKLKKQEQKGEESPSKICFVLFLFFNFNTKWKEVYSHTIAMKSINDLFTINQFFPPVLLIVDFSLVKLSFHISAQKKKNFSKNNFYFQKNSSCVQGSANFNQLPVLSVNFCWKPA